MKKVYPKFYGRVAAVNGHLKFVPDHADYYQKYMDNNTKPGQRYTFALLPYRKPRTTGSAANLGEGKGNQNGYYWSVVIPLLAEQLGLELWQVHEELKLKFLPTVSKLNPGKVIGGTTQKLDRTQWEDLMERIRVWAITDDTINVKIPLPNEAATEDEADHDTAADDEDVPDPINPLIELFKEVNPNYERLYANKNQRAALERMIKKHGIEKMAAIIQFLPTSNANKYAPTITTPYNLEAKLGDLIAWGQKQKKAQRKVANLGKK